MQWFVADAPIRRKMFLTFALMTGLVALTALSGVLAATMGSVATAMIGGLACIAATAWAGAWIRRAICDPYVNTVVRMEALAAGDLDSPVAYTDYNDCVGRMTKAMHSFRDAAVLQRRQAVDQKLVVDILSSHLASLSRGDLTSQIRTDFPADYLELRTDFNAAIAKLRDLIGAVSESAAAIRTGSGEIAQASEDLSRRTESNAASLEETAASVTQIDGRLRASATAASQTVERADQAISTVGGGRAVADEAVQAMGRVSESAKGIDSVIEGLDKIAFQTRVLAMNAAVEAGRAGDAGRGFAVVADLVSALAMRAEEEAKAARDQLTVTQADIVAAVDAVGKVDRALADISASGGEATELAARIAADNEAQSSAITQISAAIGTMDQATQQNAAMVEQTSAAARNLASEVGGLADQAARFKVGVGATKQVVARTVTASASQAPARAVFAAAEDWTSF